MYIEAKDEWFEKRLSNNGNYLYPKDEFLLSIWDKADEAIWYQIFTGKKFEFNTASNYALWSTNIPFNSEDDVFYFQPKSLIQLVKFDNLTDDEILYLSLKYNPINVIIKESNNNVSC